MNPSTKALNKWATTICEQCGKHGGGHDNECTVPMLRRLKAQAKAQRLTRQILG